MFRQVTCIGEGLETRQWAMVLPGPQQSRDGSGEMELETNVGSVGS